MRPAVRTAHLATIAAAAGLLIYQATQQWFHVDEWDYLAFRGIRLGGTQGLFYPEYVHWSTIPILFFRVTFDLVGVRDYWLYCLPVIAASLAAGHLLWRLMLRHQVEPWTATVLVGSFLVLGVGYEDLIRAIQIGLVGSVAFGLLAVDAVDRDRPWLSTLWSACALMCSAVGVPMVAACGLVALARRKPRAALIAVLPPTVLFLLWWSIVGHKTTGSTSLALGHLISYVWSGLTGSMAGYVDLPHFVGVVVVAGLVGGALWKRNVPAALAATSILFYVVVGVGRDGLSESSGALHRYSYVVIALSLPLFGQLLTVLTRHRAVRPVVLAALALLIGVNVFVFQRDAGQQAKEWAPAHRDVDAAAYLVSRGGKFSGAALVTGGNPGALPTSSLPLEKLAAWVRMGQFPVPASVAPSVLRLERAILGVFPSPGPAHSVEDRFVRPSAQRCVRLTPKSSVLVRLRAPGSLRVDPSNPTRFSTDNPVIVGVRLEGGRLRTQGAYAFMTPEDHWLNLPAAGYRRALVSAFNDTILVCQGTGARPG